MKKLIGLSIMALWATNCFAQQNSPFEKGAMIITIPGLNVAAYSAVTGINADISNGGGMEARFIGMWYFLDSRFGITGDFGLTAYGLNNSFLESQMQLIPQRNPTNFHLSPFISLGSTYLLGNTQMRNTFFKIAYHLQTAKATDVMRFASSESTEINNPSFIANRADDFYELNLKQLGYFMSVRPEFQLAFNSKMTILSLSLWTDIFLPRKYEYSITNISGVAADTSKQNISSSTQLMVGVTMAIQLRILAKSKG